MKPTRLSSPVSDVCAVACALAVFGAAILDAPVRAERIAGPAEASAAGTAMSNAAAPPGAMRRAPR